MCNKITKVAEQNRYQWVGICSHGSAHIFWRTTHICLPYEQLEAVMNQAASKQLAVEVYDDNYLLWLNQVAVKLDDNDYQEIQSLLAQAASACGSSSNKAAEPTSTTKAISRTNALSGEKVVLH
ncbi:hypothetical protein ACFOEK_05025 [Litoribrevibacter euphylliae]|uniref:Uncharacterized protein n=1 Tax=Litoribrevibacter euphylliae TaxID=1834034 RepID=A0ABV7HE36_9GAMM